MKFDSSSIGARQSDDKHMSTADNATSTSSTANARRIDAGSFELFFFGGWLVGWLVVFLFSLLFHSFMNKYDYLRYDVISAKMTFNSMRRPRRWCSRRYRIKCANSPYNKTTSTILCSNSSKHN